MIILIPAYEPDQQLPALIRSIRDAEPWATVVVVDDGSGPEYKAVFDGVKALGCHVIGYSRNRGKGFALKTGFGFIADHLPDRNVVCADSDGQHTIVDIFRVAAAVQPGSPAMVLGTLNFTGNVPARSKFGNSATRLLFRLATGECIPDTQTGLRGYPAAMLPWLRSVRGERYEYELNLLLEAKQSGYVITTVDIATVYLDHNSGSHFRPVADSVRIYAPLLKFLASSFTAFLVDTVMFLLLTLVTDSLLLAVVGARAVSSTVNFLVNRGVVFQHGRDRPAAAAGLRYFSLVLVLLAANYGLISAQDSLSVAALPAKILAEIALLAVSYVVQQRFLFSRRTARGTAREAEDQALDLSRGHHPGTLRR
ncbi:bifunctional glycosyltransferase family 2/GtrA family protein [Pseudarthrobacter raffinosi]|uniref:bifunctional glycosyltransferase family 2/GtrA family protein n=1 Tax=Pseudarthrobacter raffinosi TaxID=2953651 RepID=UPI00208FC5D7|nr:MULTISPECIES: bifunctional glycosyltransferase family 2/GtrA family protein [unclassified Pseudarthrobacter]MCO4238041.1 bifunctional glycosyltransferase family 2/GtrA family protein [Pseudarthrobacter sp. MDT3-28]MCO4251627.1 bifunctional glycosyltransferase family 2/GtrA family protein [Pseudarthrobacter sp. MDT3-9]MCO4264524.1 bifunctional glycosyltransferase family 2/GtrA family protein [Pseudarthrobacter sp. MDT3-26]